MNSWLLGCLVLIFCGVYALGIVEPSAEFLSGRRLQIGVNDRKLEFNLQTSNLFSPEFEVTHVDSTGQEIKLPFDTSRFYQGTTSSGHLGIFQIQDKIVHSATILTGDDLISLERKENKLILQKFSELEDHHLLSKASKPCFNGTGVKQEAVVMKRQVKTNATCSIQLVADSDFVSRFADNNAVSNYMATVFGGMNTIFQSNFPGKIAMSLSGIKIYSDPNTDPYLNVGGGQNEYQNLLNKVQSNVISGAEKEACLVHLFTHRNLQGTMGVAFVGGICSPQNRGRNAGMTTTMYIDGSTSSMLRHTASFTHECGHNFGASHDGDQSPIRPECSPPNAPYLMYFSTLSAAGSKNQFTFSPCSMENITSSVKSCFNVDLSTMTRTVPVQFAYPTTGSLETSSNNSSSAIKLAGMIAGIAVGGVCIIVIAVVITLKISRSRQIQ